ncbi:MAG: response regulator [Chromatiales bacterium]|nr:response regulator [Chromatiales bacterium]
MREAADGEAALELLVEPPPDLVLLDVDMPGIDGFEVCRRIRQRWDATEVPVIMVTGMDDLASINQAYEAGANDFISKPINWPILGYRARYVLRSAQAAHTLRELEQKQAAIVRAMPDMIFLLDRDGTYLDYKEGYGTMPFVAAGGVPGAHRVRDSAGRCRPDASCTASSAPWTRAICSRRCTSCRWPTASTTTKGASRPAARTRWSPWCATSRCRS